MRRLQEEYGTCKTAKTQGKARHCGLRMTSTTLILITFNNSIHTCQQSSRTVTKNLSFADIKKCPAAVYTNIQITPIIDYLSDMPSY